MKNGDDNADSPREAIHTNGDRFISPTDTQAAFRALRRACLEWPPNVVADAVSQVLFEEQEPDPALARTTHEGIARLIDYYLGDANPPDGPPDWLTPPVIERIAQRLRRREP